jgi:predicted Fe-S protein YdhL (DUF1289 family)
MKQGMSNVVSPCAGICVMNTETKECVGCRRTLDEIAKWATMTDEERLAVWDEIFERRCEGR